MPDIIIECPECHRDYTVSEYATLDGMTCVTCSAPLSMPESTGGTTNLRVRSARDAPGISMVAPSTPAAPPPMPESGEGQAVPVVASIQAMTQAGLVPEGSNRVLPKWIAGVIALAVIVAFVSFQWKADDLSSSMLTYYEWGRNGLALGAWLVVVLVAFQDGLGPGVLCLVLPPYSLFYVMACVESHVLRGVFYGILISLCAETYLLQDHSIVLAAGVGLKDFIEHVDGLIVRASESPI